MELRPAETDDADAIRDVASRSFRASYSLSPQDIETLVEENIAETVSASDGDEVVVVAERDGEVAGFADGTVADGTGELRWVHVAPEERGRGTGTELAERAESELRDRGASNVQLRVLAENSEGTAFAEHLGFERVDRAEIDLGGESYVEHIYGEAATGDEEVSFESDGNDPSVEVPETVTADGDELSVSEEEVPGDAGPFFVIYRSDERYGFFCSNCGSTDTTADELDRVKCGNCGNVHRPDEWDDGYL